MDIYTFLFYFKYIYMLVYYMHVQHVSVISPSTITLIKNITMQTLDILLRLHLCFLSQVSTNSWEVMLKRLYIYFSICISEQTVQSGWVFQELRRKISSCQDISKCHFIFSCPFKLCQCSMSRVSYRAFKYCQCNPIMVLYKHISVKIKKIKKKQSDLAHHIKTDA